MLVFQKVFLISILVCLGVGGVWRWEDLGKKKPWSELHEKVLIYENPNTLEVYLNPLFYSSRLYL